MLEPNFTEASSLNLPRVDMFMVAEFLSVNSSFVGVGMKGVIAVRSERENFGDKAIGYVQLKREGNFCTLKCRISPERKVRNKQYALEMIIDESEGKIKMVKCLGCAAAQGGCKHAIAFIMWAHRRSEEPSPTESECYWKKSNVAKIRTGMKFLRAAEINETKEGKNEVEEVHMANAVFLEFISQAAANSVNAEILSFFQTPEGDGIEVSMHNLALRHLSPSDTPDEFLVKCAAEYSIELCLKICNETKLQSGSSLWLELKWARITASKVLEAANCRTPGGALVQSIMGARKLVDNETMKQSSILEDQVLQVVSQRLKIVIHKVGLILDKEYPALVASPDGLGDDFVVEVKCPSSFKTKENYVNKKGIINAKFRAQMQLQMMFAKKLRCLFCVASPDFDKTKNVDTFWLSLNKEEAQRTMRKAMTFWKKCIFPHLHDIYS